MKEDLTTGQRASAAIGGAVISAVVVNPLEVVKTRLQMGGGAVATMRAAFQQILREEGPRSLWRGTSVQALNALPCVGLYLVAYDQAFATLQQASASTISPSVMPMLSGVAARSVAVLLSAPMENVRTRLYASGEQAGKGVSALHIVRQEVELGGILRLWRGLGPYFLRDVPFSAVYWTVVEHSRTFIFSQLVLSHGAGAEARGSLSTGHGASTNLGLSKSMLVATNLISGLTAGVIAGAVTSPVDVVYVNKITSGGSSSSVVARIYSAHGVGGFFRGLLPRVLKVAPSCAIVIASYELFKRLVWTSTGSSDSETDKAPS